MIYKEQENIWYQQQFDRIESLKKEHTETKEVLHEVSKTLESEILVKILHELVLISE